MGWAIVGLNQDSRYALAFDLLLGNTYFKKRDSHLITYKSGNAATQIDYILFPTAMRKLVTDVNVIPGEIVAQICNISFLYVT